MHFEGVKLVFTGPVGAGKTTALRTLSDMAPVSTEMPLSDGPMGEKTTTTVALDFSTVILDDGTPLQLFGLPGQEHFSHMWPIVMQGALGVLLLLSASSEDIGADCRYWVRSLSDIAPDIPIVIGVTKTDIARDFRLDAVRGAVASHPFPIPVFTIDARDREQTSQLVRALLLVTL